MTNEEVIAALRGIKDRIDQVFDENADKYQADKQYALEDIEGKVDDLIARIES
jgi:hypothetical protein